MRTAVFVGRLEPLHRGHVQLLFELGKSFDSILIVIGSPCGKGQTSRRNPLTTAERKALLRAALRGFPVPYRVTTQRDVGINTIWRDELRAKLPRGAVIFSGNRNLRAIMRPYFEVHGVKKKVRVRATMIRQWVRQGNARWKRYVPPRCIPLLVRFGMEGRLQK